MLVGIIFVSVFAFAAFIFGVFSLVKLILHFKEKETRNRNIVIFVTASICFIFLCGLNTFLIIKHVYDNRNKIADATFELLGSAIDKTAELTVRGAMATASAYRSSVTTTVINRFKGLEITYSSSRFEIEEDKKIYEIALVLDNNLPAKEEIYFGNLVQNNYLAACDTEDFAYAIIPQDGDSGFIEDRALISLVEFFFNREYTKYGKILPGKTMHKVLVVVPRDVELAYMQFLDRRIDIK